MKFNLKNLIECVPNFSEGRDEKVIREIVTSVESSENIYLLGTDSGESANRTVVTFAGPPDAVFRAAFRAYEAAYRLIDMSRQGGNHPRIGALDVCPIVPFDRSQLSVCLEIADKLAKRVSQELEIPVYLYGESSRSEGRTLSAIRKGGYESLGERILKEGFIPDYGPNHIKPRFGATVIGARHILIAYNVNLSNGDLEIARSIAKDVRTSFISKKKGSGGEKTIRAIGWYVDEYDCCQVSMNLTDHNLVSMKEAFDLVKKFAANYNIAVSGSELVGLAPLNALVPEWDGKANLSDMVDVLNEKIEYLGLSYCYPFKREEKIIEYRLNSLIDN